MLYKTPAWEDLDRIDRLVEFLDDRYRIPGTRWRIGVDGLVGLVPGIGDIATTGFALVVLVDAARFDIPKRRLVHMGWNIGVDLVLGSIPVVGDIFDIGWKANNRNLRILRVSLAEATPVA